MADFKSLGHDLAEAVKHLLGNVESAPAVRDAEAKADSFLDAHLADSPAPVAETPAPAVDVTVAAPDVPVAAPESPAGTPVPPEPTSPPPTAV